ncbi:MAG: ECF transporter S component [Clostridia bacterium]|nr:ECF transporter S component [Clostridia bacterium]
MRNRKTLEMVQLAILTAIVVIFAFTPIGYLKTPAVEITFLCIPVAVGAIVLGPVPGMILGAVFGITSFLQAALGMSTFGATLFAINPVFTALLCLVPRILCGLLPAWIFRGLSRIKKLNLLSYGLSALSCALLNTIFFVGGLILLFGRTDYIQGMQAGKNILAFAVAFVGLNGLLEAIVTLFVGGAVAKGIEKANHRITNR